MAGRKSLLLFGFIVIIASGITSFSDAEPGLSWPILLPALVPTPSSTPCSRGIKGGYWPSWLATQFPPSTIPTTYFNHLFYAFIELDASTYKLIIKQGDDQIMKTFTSTLHAQNPPTKALLSIVGGDSPSTFSTMISSATNRAAFINSSIEVARNYGFDGLDVDWEFPETPDDMSNLGVLFQEWHDAVAHESASSGRPQLLLTAAVYFASHFLYGTHRAYPFDAITKYVDFVSPMCFNYYGSWDTSLTGEHALLYDKSSNVSTSYGISTWIEAGVPPEKIVMGLPLFGRTWKLRDPNVHGIEASAVGVGTGNEGIMTYSEILDYNKANAANVVYHNETVSTYSYAGTNWIGYDGYESTVEKVKFAKYQGLGGYFFWALGYDQIWILPSAASSTWDNCC